jgi:hypothetical protein
MPDPGRQIQGLEIPLGFCCDRGRAYIGMSAHGKGGTYHYYACTARQKYGPKACRGERVPREKHRRRPQAGRAIATCAR